MAASDLLTLVEQAITDLLTDKISGYRLPDGRMVQRHNLSDLIAFRDKLQGEVATQTASGGMVTRAYVVRGGGAG